DNKLDEAYFALTELSQSQMKKAEQPMFYLAKEAILAGEDNFAKQITQMIKDKLEVARFCFSMSSQVVDEERSRDLAYRAVNLVIWMPETPINANQLRYFIHSFIDDNQFEVVREMLARIPSRRYQGVAATLQEEAQDLEEERDRLFRMWDSGERLTATQKNRLIELYPAAKRHDVERLLDNIGVEPGRKPSDSLHAINERHSMGARVQSESGKDGDKEEKGTLPLARQESPVKNGRPAGDFDLRRSTIGASTQMDELGVADLKWDGITQQETTYLLMIFNMAMEMMTHETTKIAKTKAAHDLIEAKNADLRFALLERIGKTVNDESRPIMEDVLNKLFGEEAGSPVLEEDLLAEIASELPMPGLANPKAGTTAAPALYGDVIASSAPGTDPAAAAKAKVMATPTVAAPALKKHDPNATSTAPRQYEEHIEASGVDPNATSAAPAQYWKVVDVSKPDPAAAAKVAEQAKATVAAPAQKPTRAATKQDNAVARIKSMLNQSEVETLELMFRQIRRTDIVAGVKGMADIDQANAIVAAALLEKNDGVYEKLEKLFKSNEKALDVLAKIALSEEK
ncbi:MAG: hypothetical protein ABIJ26_06735, partial [Candidatus Margulisiibacteriota bacterium]